MTARRTNPNVYIICKWWCQSMIFQVLEIVAKSQYQRMALIKNMMQYFIGVRV